MLLRTQRARRSAVAVSAVPASLHPQEVLARWLADLPLSLLEQQVSQASTDGPAETCALLVRLRVAMS